MGFLRRIETMRKRSKELSREEMIIDRLLESQNNNNLFQSATLPNMKAKNSTLKEKNASLKHQTSETLKQVKPKRSSSRKKMIYNYKTFSILVLGASYVGKTCLIRRYVDDTFDDTYSSTVSDVYETGTFVEDERSMKQIDLELKDFGSELKNEYTELYFDEIYKADGFVLVYSDLESFKWVLEAISDIERVREERAPVLILENKSDLDHGCVDCFMTADLLKNIETRKVSAKKNLGVKSAISWLINNIERTNS